MGRLRASIIAGVFGSLWHCSGAGLQNSPSPTNARVVTAEGEVPAVPPTAPDSLPEWMYDDSNLVALPDWYEGGLFIRDVVGVVFRPGTPVADRQAAIDRGSGTVIGGMRPQNGEGFYYLLPASLSFSPLEPAQDSRFDPTVVTGVVLDSAGAHLVYPSRVDLLGSAVFALGDSQGRFVLSPASRGEHLLRLRGIGFLARVVTIVAKGDSLRLGPIRLRPSRQLDSLNLIAP